MENIEIARTLDEVADLLEIQDANPFRVRAYRTAARTVGALDRPVAELLADDPDALEQLPGIGADLAGKIAGLAKSGRLPLLGQLTRRTPESLVAMLRLPGLGPKRARLVYEKLGVRTLAQLERAARAGKLSTLPGIGATLEQTILRGIQQDRARGGRFPLAEAEAYVHPLIEALREAPGVRQLDIAGSMRRRSETVGDVDILVAVARDSEAADRFVHFADVSEVLAEGPSRCAVKLRSGLQVDLRLVMYICPSTIAQHAAIACFDDATLSVYEERRAEFRRRRDFLVPALRGLGFGVPVVPDGAFYIYADVSRFSEDSFEFVRSLLRATGVCLVPGKDFGVASPERYVRVSYATSLERLEEAVERMRGHLA